MLHSLVFNGRLSPLKYPGAEENRSILLLQCTGPLKINKTLIFFGGGWFGLVLLLMK